jgi:hypothetical protein
VGDPGANGTLETVSDRAKTPVSPRWKVQPAPAPEFRIEDDASAWRAVLTGEFQAAIGRHLQVEESHIERAIFTGAQLPQMRLTDVVVDATRRRLLRGRHGGRQVFRLRSF